MNTTRHSNRPFHRTAFTLVELLIVVGLVLVLATMTLLAVDFTFQTERVRSGARQLQSMLEGARNRAIHAGSPRGVRFLVEDDPLSGRKSASMIYIASTEPWSKGTITLMRSDFAPPYDVLDTPAQGNDRDNNNDPDKEVYMIKGSPDTRWYNLLQRGYLPVYEIDSNGNGIADPGEDLNGNGVLDQRTARIKIPGDRNGTWYNVSTHRLGQNPGRPNVLELIRPYRDPGTSAETDVIAFEGTGINSYILELPPRVLADAEPVLLPAGVAIDLDASDVPDYWRPTKLGNPPIDVQWQTPYSSQMDVLFSPRGTVTGTAAAKGLIHFCITQRDDIFAITVNGSSVTGGVSTVSVPPGGVALPWRTPAWSNVSWNSNQVVVGENSSITMPAVGDRAVVSVFTQTGKVASYPLNAVDSNGNKFADDPYLFAKQGKGLTQ